MRSVTSKFVSFLQHVVEIRVQRQCLQPKPGALVGLAKLRQGWSIARRSRAARKVWSEKVEGQTHSHRARAENSEEESRRLHGCGCVLRIETKICGGYRCG